MLYPDQLNIITYKDTAPVMIEDKESAIDRLGFKKARKKMDEAHNNMINTKYQLAIYTQFPSDLQADQREESGPLADVLDSSPRRHIPTQEDLQRAIDSPSYADPEYRKVAKEYLEKILDLGRHDKKPRKDLIYARQIMKFISYFFDDMFEIEDKIPEEVSAEDAKEILTRYLATYDHADDQQAWFEKIRTITGDLGYAVRPKDYKKDPDSFKGHVGHVSTVIRIALMGRTDSPDMWEIQQILGEDRVRARISKFAESL